MKITEVEIRNFRSLFGDDEGNAVRFAVAEGMNTLVGANNCGKSNILKALALALDPDQEIDRDRDMPAQYAFAVPKITLAIRCDGPGSPERTLLRRAGEYERSVKGSKGGTFAEDGFIRFAVSFPGSDRTGARRTEELRIAGRGAIRGDPQLMAKALEQFHRCYRFVSVESGQSLESLLQGRFSEILHTVLKDHVRDEFEKADRRRSGYVESLQETLLGPLRDGIRSIVGDLFPDIVDVTLVPRVSNIDETLSNVEVNLRDSMVGTLATKGTGVRGAVMVSMLRYLADYTKRSMVFAIEEPEAFLHPAAQEDLRDDLERLADRRDVTLFVSTHSPFVVSRSPDAQIISLTKTAEGRTKIVGCARGDEPKASLLGDLFRDAALADVLERSAEIPATAKAVLVTEGDGDIASLRLAAERSGRTDLLDGIHLSAAGGATKTVVHALVARSQTAKPVMVLLDNDDEGKKAREMLVGRFQFQNKKDVTHYGELFKGDTTGIEAEDVWPPELIGRFVDGIGEDVVLSAKWKRSDGCWHYDIRSTAKEELGVFLDTEVKAPDCDRWVELMELIRGRLGI